jgi:cytochrome d ubiquinol oxidase subunit I
MTDPVFAHRVQFAFTVMFHYLFPILTMGLVFFIALLSTMHLATGKQSYAGAARFWAKIFAVNFALGVVTGIPLEFEFGTNWSRFSAFGGGVFGQTLPLEGVYAFFLESGFLGLFLFGEGRVSKVMHWMAGVGVALGSLLSGYFIVATDAWMQHPVGYITEPSGAIHLASFWQVLLNPYAGWQYAHTINGALLTAAFVTGGVGAFYLLSHRHHEFASLAVKMAVIAGAIFAVTMAFPTGDLNSRNVVRHQPTKLASMEGLFETSKGAPLAIIGMPDTQTGRLIDPIYLPNFLSYLAYGSFTAEVDGLNTYPKELWPPVELTYYAYHIMVGLGTLFIAQTLAGVYLLWRKKLLSSRWYLWTLMVAVPFPYIANEFGWLTAEVGRQPWLVYGLMKTAEGTSANVPAAETVFTTLGFAGIYALLGLLFLLLVGRIVLTGPEETVDGIR